MKQEDLSRKVAEGLGFVIHDYPVKPNPWPTEGEYYLVNGHVRKCTNMQMDRWDFDDGFTPSTNLQQAVDHVDEAVEKEGYYISTADKETYLMLGEETIFDCTGKGGTRSEVLAHGRCLVFLEFLNVKGQP